MKSKKLILFLILVSPLWAKEYVLKFPSPVPEIPQKPKIDFQAIVEKSELPIELRNFRIKEEAEKEKKLVLKGLPKHILESRGKSFHPYIQRGSEGLNIKLDFFPKIVNKSGTTYDGSMFTLGFSAYDTKLNVFSGCSAPPFHSSIIGGNFEKEYGLSSFCLGLIHKRNFLKNNPSAFYNVSLFADFEILNNLKLLFDFNYIYFYNTNNILDSISPKMEIAFRPSKSWLFKGEFSYFSHHPILEIEDSPFFTTSSNVYSDEPFNSYALSFSFYRFLFSDFCIGIKLSYKDIDEPVLDSAILEKRRQNTFLENGSAFHSLLILSREKDSGINFSLSSGVLIPSLFFTVYNLPLNNSTPASPFIFTFSSLLKGDIELSGTSFEISYNWTSFPYVSLSLKDIYSSKILLEQEIPISKIIGGNIAIVIELRNLINFLKPPITDRYLLIFYPQWIRGGVEIQF